MSKIFDALRKAEETTGRSLGVAASTAQSPERITDSVLPAEIVVSPVELELPLEFARELGTLRAAVDQMLLGRSQHTLLIAGAVAGEGASTVAAAFSRLLAEDESLKVALVDADLRSARRRLPEVDPGSGFPGVLAGSQAVERALVGTSLPNFMVLPGGVPTDTPQRLCTAENCRPILEHLKRHYHFVIIDGAPILEAPETTALASQVDGTILVVRASRTKREVVQRAMNTIEKFQGRVLGAILNRQQYVIPEFIYRRI